MTRPNNVPRAGTASLRAGPTNVIWLIACDYVNTRLTHRGRNSTAGGWWRYANNTTPASAASGSQIWRMNGVRTTSVAEHANDPVATLDTLASAIRASYSITGAEDMVFYWHGTHVNMVNGVPQHAGSEQTPIQLNNSAEEYFGNLHTQANDPPLPPARPDSPNVPAADRWPRSRDPQTFDGILAQRRNAQYMFMFNWPEADRLGNTHYTGVIAAMRRHPHVKRFHLLGCDLADLTYLNPILDLTEDIRTGRTISTPGGAPQNVDPAVNDKEVWVYNDFTQTAFEGTWLYMSHQHEGDGPASYGVKENPDGSFEQVVLYQERALLAGWQVRGRVVNGTSVVEKLTQEMNEDLRNVPVVKQYNAQNLGTSAASVRTFPVRVPGAPAQASNYEVPL